MRPALLIACALLGACSSSQLGRNELASQSARAKEIRSAMDQTVIPEVDVQNVKAEEALHVWSEKSQEYHPKHFKFQHVVSYPMTFTQGATKRAALPVRAPTVTVRRKNITSKRLLDEICRQSNLSWTIAGRVILIRPRDSLPDGPR